MYYIYKNRIYIKNPSDAPKGVKVQEGKRGGIYYESSEISTKPEEKPQPKQEIPKETPYKTGERILYQSTPNTIKSNFSNISELNNAINFSKSTKKEIGYQINRAEDGTLVLGEKTEGISGAVINGKLGNVGYFHTHPDNNIVDGFSRSDFRKLLTDKNTQMLAIQNININNNGWIAMRTAETPILNPNKMASWQIKGNIIVNTKEEYIEKYAKSLLIDLQKANIKLYYGSLSGDMIQVNNWEDYQRVVMKK